METRNYVTDLPKQINQQIQQNTQKYDVNTGGVREVLNEGVNPIPLTELGSTFDQMVAPSAPSIRYSKAYIEGKPAITLVIDFSGRDELGLEINDDIRCDIFRDENNDGLFSDDECLQQLDLRKVNNYTDKTAPANKIVRYRCLVKNMRNGLQQWSQPLVINTADTVTPYTPVSPLSITNGASTIDEKNNTVTTMLKIEKHVSEYLKHMELYYKQKDQAEWSQAIILDEKTATKEEVVEGVTVDYYIYYLSGLSRGQLYSVKVKAIMKTGTESEFSAVHDFTAGDFVAPNPPRNVKSVNLCSTTSLKIQTTWDRALEVFDERDVVKYQIVRWQYNSAAGAYVNPTNPLYEYPDLIAEAIVDQNDLDKEKYTYEHTLDSADENKYYTYGVRSVDSFGNYSAYVYGELVQAIVEIDSALTWIVWQANNENNFPMRVIWKYEPTVPSGQMLVNYGIEFIRNSDNARIAFFQVANDPTKKITHEGNAGCSYIDISIDMFGIEAVKEFLAIPNWQIDHNYAVRIAGSFMDIGGSLKRFSMQDGEETFLINPRPSAVTGFSGIYSNVDHQVKFKWAKNTFASLTGYVLKQITEADYTSLLAHPADTAEDRAIRLGIWNNGTIIADDKVLKKDVTTYNYKLTEALNPASPLELFFLIKPVGNFLNTEKYSDINTRKIYSNEAVSTTTVLSSILPAPTNCTALMYNAEMKVDWTHEYEFVGLTETYTEIAKTKLKEFIVYMSQTESDLSVDIPDDKFKVYSGVKSVCVFRDYIDPSNPPNLISVQRGQTYYFKIIPFDSFGYRGVSTPVFQNTILAAPAALPKPRIIGDSKQRFISLPYGTLPYPATGTISVDVYNNRNFQVEIPEFTKDRNVDRIKFYWLINKTFTYIEGMDLLLALSSAEISQSMTMKAQRKSFALPTDKTLFQIVAVQARGDVEEGNLPMAIPTNYSIVDTQAPSLDITKVVYVADGTNAINKNNYINKKVLDGGIDIYFNAYEKEPNSQIQKVEYSLTEGSWTAATLSDGKFRVTNVQLGDDKDGNGKYRDIQILVRAFDNADNTCDRAIVFRKDTVGPAAADLPTSLTWAFGRDVKLTWVNPAVQDRNLFDGLKLFIGGALETAKEYTLDTNPFVFRPSVNPGNNAVELYLAAFDIADNYTYLDKDGVAQESATKITITNLAPAAPTNVIVESLVGGAAVSWDIVNTTVPEDPLDLTTIQEEEVEKYLVEYAIAETKPVAGSASWIAPATGGTTYTTNLNVSLSASEMDQFADNGSLKLWVRVKAVDYWALAGDWSTDNAFGYPKNITAVDMGNNIFKFKLSSDKTLVPYVNEGPSGTTQHILDANYIDAEHIRFTVDSTTNNYIKIDMNKVEWISHIKLKFRHSSTVRFVIKLEEVSGATTQDVWLQSSSTSNHDFTEANEILVTYSKPDANRYFEFSTTNSNIVDIAELKYTNFDTGKAILAKSVSIYFYSANGTEIKMVEFQPVVMSIANIFYGSEINLDTLVSIKSKADPNNYAALDKTGLYLYKSGVNIFTANTSGVYVRNATSTARTELNSTGLVVYNASNAEVSKIGFLDTNIYGAWLRDRVYIGGTAYGDAPIQIVGASASISLGGLYAAPGQAYISGANGSFSTNGGLSTNYLSATASGSTMGPTDSQVSATSSGTEIKQKVGIDTTKGWSQYNNYYIQFGVGTTYGESVRSRFGRLATDVYGSWMTGGVYIGGSSYANCELRLTASTLEMGYISSNVYNMTLTSSVLSIGRTGSYYNTKIESGAISLGHLSGGTDYAMTMNYSGAAATRYFSIKGADLTEYFRVAQYTIDSIATNAVWSKTMLLMGSYSGDITSYSGYDGANTRLYIVNPPSVGSAGCAAAIFSYYTQALECRTTYATAIYANAGSSSLTTHGVHGISSGGNGSTHPYENSAGVKGEGGYNTSVTGVYGYSHNGYGGRFLSLNSYGIYSTSTNATSIYSTSPVRAMYGITTGSNQCAIWGETTAYNATGVHGESSSGRGVDGYSSTNNGVVGTTGSGSAYGGYFNGPTYALRIDGATVMVNMAAAGTGTALVIDSEGIVRKQSSSLKYKDILSYIEDFSMLKYNQLMPYKFRFKESGDLDIGFIAEWIEPIFPDLVNYNNNGLPESLKYDRFSVYNVLAIQEHDRIINEQKNEIELLKQELATIKNMLQEILK